MCEEVRRIYVDYLKRKKSLMEETLDKFFECCSPEDEGIEEMLYTLSEAIEKVDRLLKEYSK